MAKKPLTIYIDGRCLLRPKDGVGSYVQHLLENVLRVDTVNKYIALGFADQRYNERLVAEHANFTYRFLPMPRRAYMGLFRLWQAPIDRLLPEKPDVVWYPDFVAAPWINQGRKILTIHDLTFLQNPEEVERRNGWYLRLLVKRSVSKADALTAVSQTMQNQIVEAFSPSQPVIVVYPAAPAETPGSPDLRDPYILFVSTLQPRKNVKTLLKAYNLLPKDVQKKYRLVLAGRRGWKDTETIQLIESTPLTWIDGPSDDELNKLFLHASLFVLPSIREGFGIPPIEALSRHVPVITSNDPALVEGTGKAAMHVPAEDAGQLAQAMTDMLQSKKLRDSFAVHRSAELAKLDGTLNARKLIKLFTEDL